MSSNQPDFRSLLSRMRALFLAARSNYRTFFEANGAWINSTLITILALGGATFVVLSALSSRKPGEGFDDPAGIAMLATLMAAAIWGMLFDSVRLHRKYQERSANRASDSEHLKKVLSRTDRWWHASFFAVSAVTTTLLILMTTATIAGSLDLQMFVIFVAMTIGPLLVRRWSTRLVRAKIDSLNYTKGTTSGREIVVYWTVLVIIVAWGSISGQTKLISETFPLGTALFGAASFAALGKIVSAGYKEYKEAVASCASTITTVSPPPPATSLDLQGTSR